MILFSLHVLRRLGISREKKTKEPEEEPIALQTLQCPMLVAGRV
jgi:hypothetical protein